MNPFQIVYVLKPAGFFFIANFLAFVGILFGLLLWWDDHKTTKEYDAAKPYILPIDKLTSLPIVDLENLKNNKFDYNSHSFFKSTKNGLFILTGGFWADINYRDIIELAENERPNKNLRTFKVVERWREGFFPESCFDSIPKNLLSRESKIESWINTHDKSYTFVDQRIDVPILESFDTICKGFLTEHKYSVRTSYYDHLSTSKEIEDNESRSRGQEACKLYAGFSAWSNKEGACKTKASVIGAQWNESENFYDLSSSYAGAEVLNEQFREHLEALKPEKSLAVKDVHDLPIEQDHKPQESQTDREVNNPLVCGKDIKADCSL